MCHEHDGEGWAMSEVVFRVGGGEQAIWIEHVGSCPHDNCLVCAVEPWASLDGMETESMVVVHVHECLFSTEWAIKIAIVVGLGQEQISAEEMHGEVVVHFHVVG